MTGLIIEIKTNRKAEAVEFYVERDRAIRFTKNELIRVYTGGVERFFALLDAGKIGRGNLICRVEFTDKEAEWDRPVVVRGFTGLVIPCATQQGMCLIGKGQELVCGDYKVKFEAMEDIPKNDGTNIFYGVIDAPIGGFEEITDQMLQGLTAKKVEPMMEIVEVKRGDKLVVAIPHDYDLKVYKDDGAGVPVKFSNSVMCANGEYSTVVDEVPYRLYGELFLVDGNVKMYIQ